MRILHISDVRIGRSQSTERYRHVFGELKRALTGANIDAVVVLGLIEYHGRMTSTDLGLCTDFINILREYTHNINIVPGFTDSGVVGKIPGVTLLQNKSQIGDIGVYYGINPPSGVFMCGGMQSYTAREGAVWAGQLIQHSFTPCGKYGCVLWDKSEHLFIPLGQFVAPEQILLRGIHERIRTPMPSAKEAQISYLESALAEDSDAMNILLLHNELSEPVNVNKWHITQIQFSNLFRYGSGNYLSLDSGGVIGLVGGNAIGKSSLLDIILFGLFGRGIRGQRDTRINIGSEQSHLLIEFFTDKIYRVERVDTIYSCKKCVFMQGDTIIASGHDVYGKIEEIIGSCDEFLYTSVYYGNLHYSVADSQRILGAILGVGNKEHSIKVLSARIKAAEKELSMIPSGDPNALGQVTEIEDQLTKYYKLRDEVSQKLSTGTLPYSKITSELISLSDEINKQTALINKIQPYVYEVVHDAPEVTGNKSVLEAEAEAGDMLPQLCVLEYERGNICGKFQFNASCDACKYNTSIVSKRTPEQIDKDIEIARRSELAKHKLKAIYNYEQSILGKRLHTATESLEKARVRYKQLNEMLSSDQPKLWDFLQELNKKIGAEEYNLAAKRILAEQHIKYTQLAAPINDNLRVLHKYKKILSGDLYPQVISMLMNEIVLRANLILEHCAKLTLCYDNGPNIKLGMKSLPLELGSGYQQFIVSIVLRALLSRSSFMIIDEGFVCADAINAERLHLLFAVLKDIFRYIIVISHLPQVQCNNDIMIHIEDIGGKSYIHSGRATKLTSDNIKCSCGKTIKMTSMYTHLRSKKHSAK